MTASLTNFLGGLYIVIGENLSDTIGSISKKDLEDMKVDLSELNRAAYAYIDTLSESATIEASNIFRTRLDGDLDSSLMLSEKFRKRAVESAGGPVLFGIPFSGDLYFVKADDAAAARLLSQFVRELFSRGQGPRPLTARLFWSDGPILRER